MENVLEDEIEAVASWIEDNKLWTNVIKTQVMFLSYRDGEPKCLISTCSFEVQISEMRTE